MQYILSILLLLPQFFSNILPSYPPVSCSSSLSQIKKRKEKGRKKKKTNKKCTKKLESIFCWPSTPEHVPLSQQISIAMYGFLCPFLG